MEEDQKIKMKLCTIEEMMEKWDEKERNKKWYNHVWDWVWFKIFYHLKPSEIKWNFRRLKCFFVRGKKGWSEIDVWNLHDYLSAVISETTKKLREDYHGFPTMILPDDYDFTYNDDEKRKEIDNKCIKEWERILETISWTFEVNKKISSDKWYMVRREDFDTEERFQQHLSFCQDMIKKYNKSDDPHHLMTDEEMAKYEDGWKYFKKYYFCLWD
jgi:hypothetical protein